MATLAMALGSCQKMNRPELASDYPKDSNPPGGPLKFYAAFDNANVDSVRANFGQNVNATYVDGIKGKAMNAGANGYIKYGSANDFKLSTSFTVSFWMKKNGPNPAGGGTSFVFGLATTVDIWHAHDIFMEIEDGGQSTATDAAAKFHIRDQWFEFTGTKKMAGILNNQWHHIVFSFDQSTSKLTTYIDGAVPNNLPTGFDNYTFNGGKADLTKAAGLVIGGPGHWSIGKTPDSWMGNFNGAIDQFRLYGKALTQAEVMTLYNGKL